LVVAAAWKKHRGNHLYGMPILNVDEADTVVMIKRSLSPGYSGGNELFYADNTKMLFSDVEEAVAEITAAAKDMEEAQALTVGTFNVERSSLQRDIGS
jgi:NAD(P) transhydrogenase subunit beta